MKSTGRHPRPGYRVLAAVLSMLALASCGSAPPVGDRSPGLVDAALKVVGLQRAEDPPPASPAGAPSGPRTLTLRLHAGQVLNTDAGGRSLALVVRVYRLRQAEAFLQAPYEVFADDARERALLRDDLVDVREMLLKPGARHEVVQGLEGGVRYIGVVGLFRAPAEQRWRFALDAGASLDGVVLGAHGCALSVAQGKAVGVAPETMRLAGVQCD